MARFGASKTGRFLTSVRRRRFCLPGIVVLNKMCDAVRWGVGLLVRRRVVILHHLACSGGSIMTKCLATMPDTLVLSEIHPGRPIQQDFHALGQLQRGYGGLLDGIDRSMIRGHFRREMAIAYGVAQSHGRTLVVRDHAHTDFAWRRGTRSALFDTLAREFKTIPIVTIRDPREVWISVRRNGWFDGTPDELCQAHLALMDAFPGAPVFRYEDFVAEPDRIVREMCEAAGVHFVAGFEARLAEVDQITGESGRWSDVIEEFEPKALSPEDAEAFNSSSAFHVLMKRLAVKA